MNCMNCNNETTNPKFCSRSCAATYNNTQHPKRKPEHTCVDCGKPCTRRRVRCLACIKDWTEKQFSNRLNNLTLSDLQGKRNYQISSQIREIARRIYRKSGRPQKCENCGYDKHFEVCHIKAIKDFSPDTLVSVINSLENLVALCPNCHWELDHEDS